MANPNLDVLRLLSRWMAERSPLRVVLWRMPEGPAVFDALISGMESNIVRFLPLDGKEERSVELEGARSDIVKGTDSVIIMPPVSAGDGVILIEPLGSKSEP